MVGLLDPDEDGEAEPDRLGIDGRLALHDDAALLEPLDAAPAGGLRQVHPARHLGDGERGILLEDCEDLEVGAVHGRPLVLEYSPR